MTTKKVVTTQTRALSTGSSTTSQPTGSPSAQSPNAVFNAKAEIAALERELDKRPQPAKSLADLRRLSPEGDSAAILGGHSTRGDGGGGLFFHDSNDTSSEDDGVDVVVTDGGQRFKRLREKGCLRAEWEGVVSGGEDVDNAPWINAGLRRLVRNDGGGVFELPPGNIKVATSIEFIDDDEHGNIRGVTLRGAGNHPFTDLAKTKLLWTGDDGGTVIKFYTRESALMHFMVAPWGKRIGRAIDLTKAGGTNQGTMTSNILQGLSLNGVSQGAGGSMDYGIVIGDRVTGQVGVDADGYPFNVSEMRYEGVFFREVALACVYTPNTSGQAKGHVFSQCMFSASPYGIYSPGRLGFALDPICQFGGITTSCIHMGSTVDTVVMRSCHVEGCARFLTSGGSAAFWAVSIDGGHFDGNVGLAADGSYIDWGHSGPLTLRGATFAAPIDGNWNIKIQSSNASGVSLITEGCVFPKNGSGDSALIQFFGAGSLYHTRLGCRRATGTSPSSVYLPDLLVT